MSLPSYGWAALGSLSVAALALFALPLSASGGDNPASTLTQSAGELATPALKATISPGLILSTINASPGVSCTASTHELKRARELIYYQRLAEADSLLAATLDGECLEERTLRDQARFQHAYLLLTLDRPQDAIARLDALEEETPIPDYIDWLYGEALEKLGRHHEAADRFQAIFDAETSPLHWRARARQAFNLASAEKWEEATPVLRQIIDLFPDYPRRHRALFLLASALHAQNRLQEAAHAYQQTNFEFPFKKEGVEAQKQLQILAEQQIFPPPIDAETRFAKYRQLSIDKFWPLAHDLLFDLRQEIATPTGDSELENQILERLALNAYHSQDFPKAARFFEEARAIIESGKNSKGFSERVIYRYHSFALATLGRHDEAIEALKTLHKDSSRRDGLQELAEHYERHGQYEEAFQLYDDFLTARQKRGWHYSYLLYKTGRLQEAYDNLTALAARSRGESRAKYLYWAGRSLERAANNDEAALVFAELKNTNPTSYYGIQAANRLRDLQERSPDGGTLFAQADLLSLQADSALEAIEEAALFAADAAPVNYIDPRTQPVPGHPDPVEATAQEEPQFLHHPVCPTYLACAQNSLLSPLLAYRLSWTLHPALQQTFADYYRSPFETRAALASAQEESIVGLDRSDARQPRVPDNQLSATNQPPRVRFNTEARIYWHGRQGSDIAFVRYDQGQMIGPTPRQWTAYADDAYIGGLSRAVDQAGHLFSNLERSYWLWIANWNTEARRLIRDVSLEFRTLSSRTRANRAPHDLPHKRWDHLIDNRRRHKRAGLWGLSSDEKRFPVPADAAARQALLTRQQEIYDERHELRPLLIEAFREVGDYHLVRRYALSDTSWLSQKPEGDALRGWSMAYPRAFPEKVIPMAQKYNVNPYMIWALMLVESSFNPDSLSVADAMGLLQVIPRTGYKIADLFGSEDFGPFDLLEEDHSIEQGVFYFSRLVQKFHGQELFAFAGYNGGPHRIADWLDMRGRRIPLDEFIEEIPFNESRGYAKKVLRFLNVYLRIYEGYDGELYVGQNIRPDYLPQPNF